MKHSSVNRFLLGMSLLAGGLPGCAAEVGSEEEITTTSEAHVVIPGDVVNVLIDRSLTTNMPIVKFPFTSGGGAITVTHLAPGQGQYRVNIPNLGAVIGGHVQVSATELKRCKVDHWNSSGSTLNVFVNCFRPNGTPVDSAFSLDYVRRSDTPGNQAAYAWAGEQSSAFYNPSTLYSWNSNGGGIEISHNPVPTDGRYAVRFIGQDLNQGTVEVTAYGAGNKSCQVEGWGSDTAYVICFDNWGNQIESQFTVLFSTESPNGSASSSYAWADQPWNTSPSGYAPSPFYSKTLLDVDTNPSPLTVSTPVNIRRNFLGNYRVTFPQVGDSATPNVKVTPYGSTYANCYSFAWTKVGFDGRANVACFNASGGFVDTFFTVTYSSRAFIIG